MLGSFVMNGCAFDKNAWLEGNAKEYSPENVTVNEKSRIP